MSIIGKLLRFALRSNLLAKLYWKHRPHGLYCFNFHRIGDSNKTPFDPCVFSCDVEDFEKHITFINKHFKIVSTQDVCQLVGAKTPINEHLALITFDDGYIDNYQLAYPILKRKNIPAIFFITTSLTDTQTIPWWDEIAWHAKQMPNTNLSLTGWPNSIMIGESLSRNDIRQILYYVKTSKLKVKQQLDELRAISKHEYKKECQTRLFMNWSELNEMQKNGMEIGAHSHSHEIFAKLNEEELQYELSHSKRLLEDNLNMKVTALSYPVGNVDTYHKRMFSEISRQGYKLAFTFCPVINKNITGEKFELGRFPVDSSFSQKALVKMLISCK